MGSLLILRNVLGTAALLMVQSAQSSTTVHGQQPAMPLSSIGAYTHGALELPETRAVVRGTVTYAGDPVVIQDQTGAIAVELATPTRVTLGDEVEVNGKLANTGGVGQLQNASLTSLWHSSMPAPLALTPDLAAEGVYDLYLVEIEATVQGMEVAGQSGSELTLQGEHQFFSAHLGNGMSLGRLDTGSRVRVTGVLSVPKTHYALDSGSFTILLRAPTDVVRIEPAPWWTAWHVLLLSLLLIPFGIGIHLLRLSILQRRFDAITAERARIARDIHDTLAQGFAGVALQLEGASQEMARDHGTAQTYLATALDMIRHSRTEAHRAIATLHHVAAGASLDALVREMALQMAHEGRPQLKLEVSGDSPSWTSDVAEPLFRIAQEAVSNALQHAHAAHIWVRVNYSPQEVVLRVEDDGAGFDPGGVAGPDRGHFGLTGMAERAERLRASMEIASSTIGTVITIRARKNIRYRVESPRFFAQKKARL